VIAVPGSAYHYSGGGYEIAEALMQDVTGKPFPKVVQDLVFGPIGMTASSFAQPLDAVLAAKAASGHFSDGPPGCGRRRPTSPSSWCSSPMPGRASLRSFFTARRCSRS
jgi:CubicO group peptidase (beta-lactamase class C family)